MLVLGVTLVSFPVKLELLAAIVNRSLVICDDGTSIRVARQRWARLGT